MFNGCGRALLGVSGGADSMAMLQVLLRLREQGGIGVQFAVGHVHHRIRQAADEDLRFVERFAKQAGMEFFSRLVDVPAYAEEHKLSLETAGRRLRISMLREMAGRWGAEVAATAHHRDDQAETVIFRMLRGTGFRGLCGIRPISELEGVRFVRPMLTVSREEILDYLHQEGLSWREDHTNADCGFSRNRIRHQILPYLHKQGSGDLAADLTDLAEQCQQLFRRVDTKINTMMPDVIQCEQPDRMELDRLALADCSPVILGEILRRCLTAMEVGLRDYTARHYQELMKGIYAGDRIQLHLPGGVECAVDEKTVTFRKTADMEVPLPDEMVPLEMGGVCRFELFDIHSRLLEFDPASYERFQKEKTIWIEWLDADKIRGPIRIRTRQPGDRFQPLGMKTEKKVGKFLTTAKVDADMKNRVFIVEDAEKILWVAPARISEWVKVDPRTSRILRIQIHRRGES